MGDSAGAEKSPDEFMIDVFTNMAAMHRRLDLLRSQPTPLDKPVYEQISHELIVQEKTGIEEFVDGLREKAALAPNGCPVFVSYEKDYGYDPGDEWTYLEVGYERPPTEKERADRKARNDEIAAVKAEVEAKSAEKERAEFERLKAKFERDSDSRPTGEDREAG